MQQIQIGATVLACVSWLLLLIALCSNYWLVRGFSNMGLWKSCHYAVSDYTCFIYGMDVKSYTHATRAFLFLGLFAGAAACICLCGIVFGWQLGSIPKAQASAIASFVAALCILIAMATFTGNTSPSYGWSFDLGWSTFPLFLVIGVLALKLNT